MIFATRFLLLLLALYVTVLVRPIDTTAIQDLELSKESYGLRGDKVTKGLDGNSAREHNSHKSQTCPTDVPSGVLVFFSWSNVNCLLPACGGDCDYDGDCEPNSFCQDRYYDDTRTIPGCLGLPVSGEDYCVSFDFTPTSAPSTVAPSPPPTTTGSPTPQPSTFPPTTEICPSSVPDGVREFFGFGPHNCLLPDCAGQCKYDTDCAPTSYCYKPGVYNSHSLPGCAGMTINDETYCVPLETKPSIVPTMEPSASLAPSTKSPSLAPSSNPPSLVPSTKPSIVPTMEPSTSFAPSNSFQPSLSQSPTFGCDVWEPIGDIMSGEYYGDQSGYSLDISSDGTIVAIGAKHNDGNGPSSGHARVFSFNDSSLTWEQLGQDINGEEFCDQFGTSIALSSDGLILAVGAQYNDGSHWYNYKSGHVQVYSYDETSHAWEQQGNDIDGESSYDNSGYSLALSANGLVVAIGAPYNDHSNSYSQGHVRVYYWNEDSLLWEQLGNDLDGEDSYEYSGHSVSLSEDGYVLAIGSRPGHVRIFSFDEKASTWKQLGDDIDGERYELLGESVTLSSDGLIVAIGKKGTYLNNYSGTVRVYVYDGSWTQRGNDIDGGDYERTGYSVSMSSDGDIVSIGSNEGPVRVYTFDQYLDTWTQIGDDITDTDTYSYSYDQNSGIGMRGTALSSDGSTIAFSNILHDFGVGMVQVKKIDRCVPSMSPSVSSPPSVQCPQGERDFKLEIQTDSKGEELHWVVKRRNKNMKFKEVITEAAKLESDGLSTTQMCLKKNNCYRFIIGDFGEDGICCAHGDGYYKIFWRGKLKRMSYFEGKAREQYQWGVCDKE